MREAEPALPSVAGLEHVTRLASPIRSHDLVDESRDAPSPGGGARGGNREYPMTARPFGARWARMVDSVLMRSADGWRQP